jgi:hypothetical protein
MNFNTSSFAKHLCFYISFGVVECDYAFKKIIEKSWNSIILLAHYFLPSKYKFLIRILYVAFFPFWKCSPLKLVFFIIIIALKSSLFWENIIQKFSLLKLWAFKVNRNLLHQSAPSSRNKRDENPVLVYFPEVYVPQRFFCGPFWGRRRIKDMGNQVVSLYSRAGCS